MAQLDLKSSTHPSGDNRFKLLDRAITRHHGSGNVIDEVRR